MNGRGLLIIAAGKKNELVRCVRIAWKGKSCKEKTRKKSREAGVLILISPAKKMSRDDIRHEGDYGEVLLKGKKKEPVKMAKSSKAKKTDRLLLKVSKQTG